MDLLPRTNCVVHGLKPLRVSMLLNNKVFQIWFVVVRRSSTWAVLILESGHIIVPVCLFITESISKNCAGSRSWRRWIGQEGHFWTEVGHSLTFLSIRLFVCTCMRAWANWIIWIFATLVSHGTLQFSFASHATSVEIWLDWILWMTVPEVLCVPICNVYKLKIWT